ncbi:MAG: hypothetical protein EHM55_13660 [Acidobacteria bacterium]|nr:MAG: hypothetical protein EHM55_13660 [Acidobacteriota bacterium]
MRIFRGELSEISRTASAVLIAGVTLGMALSGCGSATEADQVPVSPAGTTSSPADAGSGFDQQIQANAKRMLDEGKHIFRYDTFGSEETTRSRPASASASTGGAIAI